MNAKAAPAAKPAKVVKKSKPAKVKAAATPVVPDNEFGAIVRTLSKQRGVTFGGKGFGSAALKVDDKARQVLRRRSRQADARVAHRDRSREDLARAGRGSAGVRAQLVNELVSRAARAAYSSDGADQEQTLTFALGGARRGIERHGRTPETSRSKARDASRLGGARAVRCELDVGGVHALARHQTSAGALLRYPGQRS
jgi:hypothetical protein